MAFVDLSNCNYFADRVFGETSMLQRLKRISHSVRFENPYWKYGYDRYRMPNGATGDYHYVMSNGSVMIVPRLADGSILLLRQYRYLNERVSIEFPGGGIEPGLSVEANAAKELAEETGYRTKRLTKIGEHNPYNGVTNEISHVFLADEMLLEDASPDESEEFELLRCSPIEVADSIRSGAIWDGMTIASWCMYRYSKDFRSE